jgi:hypothetical protein
MFGRILELGAMDCCVENLQLFRAELEVGIQVGKNCLFEIRRTAIFFQGAFGSVVVKTLCY